MINNVPVCEFSSNLSQRGIQVEFMTIKSSLQVILSATAALKLLSQELFKNTKIWEPNNSHKHAILYLCEWVDYDIEVIYLRNHISLLSSIIGHRHLYWYQYSPPSKLNIWSLSSSLGVVIDTGKRMEVQLLDIQYDELQEIHIYLLLPTIDSLKKVFISIISFSLACTDEPFKWTYNSPPSTPIHVFHVFMKFLQNVPSYLR